MQSNFNLLFFAILCYLPIVFAIAVIFWKRRDEQKAARVPFTELRRRPAGEALRLKLGILDEKINDALLLLILCPAVLVGLLLVVRPAGWGLLTVCFILSVITSFVFGKWLLMLIREWANYRLGFEGERFVGEELSRLIGLGFEVFHDVPFDGFNMDHVLVGRRGVFVVETKTRRKPVGDDGKKEFRVRFDGKLLHWPWGADSGAIDQARNNAKTLAAWLSSATGENVWATPILTLPGWLVERKVPADRLHVLNAKEIYVFCESLQRESISEPQIRRMIHHLNEKCRIGLG